MNAVQKYNQRVDSVNSLACVSIDSNIETLPKKFKDAEQPQFEFNKFIIEQTQEYVSAFKFNIAFYEARGNQGYAELKMSMDYLKEKYPDILTICDCKRGDNENTNKAYVASLFDWFGFDAVTLHPYLGKEALAPFLERRDKGCIILCRTSNPGAGELQDLLIDGKPLWQIVASKVTNEWNKNNNCLLVVGATYPEEMKAIRALTGDMTFLVPGAGKQGGDVAASVRAGLNAQKKGMIIVSGRGIIFAENPKLAIKELRDTINSYR